jgi:glutamate carboxypeptidase
MGEIAPVTRRSSPIVIDEGGYGELGSDAVPAASTTDDTHGSVDARLAQPVVRAAEAAAARDTRLVTPGSRRAPAVPARLLRPQALVASAVLQSIRRSCREHEQEMLETLARIVNTDSATPDSNGVDAVAAILEPELLASGCVTERVMPDLPGDDLAWLREVILPELEGYDRLGQNLVGRRGGSATAHALLIGHMDTAFPIGEARLNPFRIEGNRAWGCAVADMKAGLVVLLYAVRALHELGVAGPRITVIYNSDEQAATLTSRPLIERIISDEGVTHAFVAEMGRAGGGIVAERASLGIGLVEVTGVERHAGTGYWDAASAVRALARKVERLEALSDHELARVVNVGVLRGGTRRNLVPGSASAHLDVRARSNADWKALAAAVRDVVDEESLAGTRAAVRLYNTRPAMERSAATATLVEVVQSCADELEQQVSFVATTGGSDASFPAALGVPTLDGFGPVGGGTMTRGEFIFVDSLTERAALLATTLHRISG